MQKQNMGAISTIILVCLIVLILHFHTKRHSTRTPDIKAPKPTENEPRDYSKEYAENLKQVYDDAERQWTDYVKHGKWVQASDFDKHNRTAYSEACKLGILKELVYKR